MRRMRHGISEWSGARSKRAQCRGDPCTGGVGVHGTLRMHQLGASSVRHTVQRSVSRASYPQLVFRGLQEFTHMVGRAHVAVPVRRALEVALPVVMRLEDAREPPDAHAADCDDASVAKEVDIRSDPATIVQLPEMVARFVVAWAAAGGELGRAAQGKRGRCSVCAEAPSMRPEEQFIRSHWRQATRWMA